MAAPTNTYDSNTDLSIGYVPQVDDPDLYRELLDIHNALEITLTSTGDLAALFAFLAKFRSVTDISADYTILVTDGTIRVDATAGDITVTMPLIADGAGYRYDIKRVDTVTTNKVTIVGDGTELIDTRAGGINLSTFSSYTIKANDTGWDII